MMKMLKFFERFYIMLLVLLYAVLMAAPQTADIDLTAAKPGIDVTAKFIKAIDDVDITSNGNAWDVIVQSGEVLLLDADDSNYDSIKHKVILWFQFPNKKTYIFDEVTIYIYLLVEFTRIDIQKQSDLVARVCIRFCDH